MDEMMARQENAGPAVFELSDGERLLVRATRKYAFRCATARLIELEFCEACGTSDGKRVADAFRRFLLLLARHARRSLALGPPGWPGATHHEHWLLQLFAAAQARSKDRLRMHLAWLMPTEAARQAEPLIVFVATALGDHDCVLPLASPLVSPPISARETLPRAGLQAGTVRPA